MDEIAKGILPYLMATIGFLIVYVLNGIKNEIGEVKVSVKGLEVDLRESISSLDRRVTHIEYKLEKSNE